MPPSKKDAVEETKETIKRLIAENGQYRETLEKVQILIRRRAPQADGLHLCELIRTVLDERDANFREVDIYREEMKKILKYLLHDKITEAKNEINTFLYKQKLKP